MCSAQPYEYILVVVMIDSRIVWSRAIAKSVYPTSTVANTWGHDTYRWKPWRMHSIPWWQRDRPYILALASGVSDTDVAAVLQRGSSVQMGVCMIESLKLGGFARGWSA